MPSAGRLAFAAAMRVVHRIHRDPAVVGLLAQPARLARLAVGGVFVLDNVPELHTTKRDKMTIRADVSQFVDARMAAPTHGLVGRTGVGIDTSVG